MTSESERDYKLVVRWLALLIGMGIAVNALAIVGKARGAEASDQWDTLQQQRPPLLLSKAAGNRDTASRGVAGGRPSMCPPVLWCGCWLATYKNITDRKQWRDLWLVRNWLNVGVPAPGPAPGVIAIYARGKNGGHVGIVTAVLGPSRIVLLSGNDNNAVRERERSTKGIIGYRYL
jgi:uncharacterized protein (TIGR02594 family)